MFRLSNRSGLMRHIASSLLPFCLIGAAEAAQWNESPDAGDRTGTAQTTSGPGSLDTINGTLSSFSDIDIFRIRITNASTFSATTTGGDSEGPNDFDAALALFDPEGLGIYFNDDRVPNDGNATLPAGNANGPRAPGVYSLAIFDSDQAALSGAAATENDLIFPILSASPPWTAVFGPTGPGGGSPLSGWGTQTSKPFTFAGYQIQLTGAEFVIDTTPKGPIVSSVLPASRSVQVGDPATAFATIINAGASAVSNCGISPVTAIAADFTYRTTDEFNVPVGAPDTPAASIPAGGSQPYVFAFTPTAAFNATDVVMSFDCTDTDPAVNSVGLNSLLLVSDTNPVPDVVALAATVSNDGVVTASPNGAFSTATVNVGIGGSINVTADTGSATLPLVIAICETDPTTAACINPASPTTDPVVKTIGANETPTFSIFVTATDTFAPDFANKRIFVRFKDDGGETRGSTSVAVQSP